MKTRLLIIIGIIIIVVIGISIGVLVRLNELDQVESSVFNYKNTDPIIDDEYLSKNIRQWQDLSMSQLNSYHEQYGDYFYMNLGKLLIKNEMISQLRQENITNANDDFDVYSGTALTSLPPHISFEAVVNGTDGKTYRLEGGTFANKVNYYKTTELVFYDTTEKLSIDFIVSQNQIIQVLGPNGSNARVVPFDLVINGDMHNIVGFENKLGVPIQILGEGDYHNPKWTGPIILPYGKGTMTFNNTGVFEWSAYSLPLPGNDWRERYGHGEISVLSDKTDSLSLSVKGKIAKAIIKNSEIPLSGIGTGNGLHIDFNPAIFEMLPDAKEYYTARAEQLVPFDVQIIIEEPNWNDD